VFEEVSVKLRPVAWLLVAAVGLITVGLTSAARADDKKGIAGDWKWEFKRQNGDAIEIALKLVQDGEKVTGTMTVNGNATEIKEGKFKDGEVSFEVTRERNGQSVTTKYKGKLDGDTIKGKAATEINGETRERDWEAKRA
jgi:hypothetical protein